MTVSSDELCVDPLGRIPNATVACFDPTCGELPRRRLDRERTVAFLERLVAAGAKGLLIAASTGEGHARTVDELAEWFAAAAAAHVGDAVLMALLRPEDGLDANRRLLAHVAKLGYPVVFFRPRTGLQPIATVEQVIADMRPLVAAAAELGLAIGLYSISNVSGAQLSNDAAAALVDLPGGERIVAVKVTEADYEASTAKYLADARLSHLKIVQGWDPHLTRAMQEGGRRVGITSGPMSLAIHQYQHLLAAAERGEWDEVNASMSAVAALFAAMQDDPKRFADLQRAKFVMGLGQPIARDIQPGQVERIFAALEALPRAADRQRIARSLDLMGDGAFHERLAVLS